MSAIRKLGCNSDDDDDMYYLLMYADEIFK